jgi:hypothetical protein
MKRIFVANLILVFTLFLLACSISYELRIVNASSADLEVRYKIKKTGSFDEPYLMSIEDWQDQNTWWKFWRKTDWYLLPKDSYKTDETNLERTILLKPNQVLRFETSNWNPISAEKGNLFDVTEIKLSGINGEVTYSGNLIYKQFVKEDESVFSQIYK